MSTVSRNLKEVSARSYVATAPFHLNFFKYTTSRNAAFQIKGDLSAVPGATSGTCPAGRVLRENGKKLFPGAHPVDTVNGSPVTFPDTVMVGVFDNQSGLSGFIDPNAPMFAVYSTDHPNYLKDSVDPVGGLTDQSAPTLTNGLVNLRQDLTVGGNSDLTGTLAVTGATTLKGGVKVATTGTLLTKILKGTATTTTTISAGTYNIGATSNLAFTVTGVTTADSIVVNQSADFAGWVVTGAWPVANGFVVKVMAHTTTTNVSVPTFNYTVIQS
jgi:hypothetical protein